MKLIARITLVTFLSLFLSCNSDSSMSPSDRGAEASSDFAGGSSGGSGNGGNSQSGIITAGEWNDLKNWNYWNDLLNNKEFSKKPAYWNFYTNNRVSVEVTNNQAPVINAKVELKRNNNVVWSTYTDNLGNAELWISLFQKNTSITINDYSLYINGEKINTSLKLFTNGVNKVQLVSNTSGFSNRVELSFVVDATGSMGDEIEFLKDDLNDVITKVKLEDSSLDIYTSTVFYRDVQDEYLVKSSDFTSNLNATINFIKKQNAGGGGDYPEAVHDALKKCIDDLQWSTNAKTRIMFLILDAPPHYNPQVKSELHKYIKKASEKGIKVIPITASGIDKNTEFLMRFFSITTNGTYTFITNDSGVGNDHIEASVGEYQVEKLNDLMVRLIKKYTE